MALTKTQKGKILNDLKEKVEKQKDKILKTIIPKKTE